MGFSLFFMFFLATILFCITFLSLGRAKQTEEGKDISNKAGLAVIASVVLGWTLLQTAADIAVFPFKEFIFGLYPFLIGACALSMYSIKSGRISRFWIYLFVSTISVVFLPNDWFVFQGLLPLFLDRLLTAILWASFISIYARMDKIENLTQTQTTALCLAFSVFPFFSFSRQIFSYSSIFSYYPLLILAALIGFTYYKKRSPEVLLGKTGAVPLGYLMGLFIILLTVKGFYMSALIMPAYYYFETIYSAIYRFIHRNNPQPKVFSFFISRIIRSNLNTKGLISRLLLFMMGLAIVPILFPTIQTMLLLTGMIFFVLIYRFLNWGKPKITYRSMFHDTKEVIGQVGSNVKDSYQTVSNYWKNKKK